MKKTIIATMILMGIAICGIVLAGDITPPAGPDDPASAMFTIEDLYNRLDDGTPGVLRTTPFTEPPTVFGSTGHSVNDVMDKAPEKDDANGAVASDVADGKTFWGLTGGEWGTRTGTASSTPAPVEKTGQTICYDAAGGVISCAGTGQDGDHLAGVEWPVPRFTDNGDGTITDNMTGLIWMKWANCMGQMNWTLAFPFVQSLGDGDCQLSDGSQPGDWRLPNLKELFSLIDLGNYNPALPTGHPFSGVQTNNYWSSTTNANYLSYAWSVSLSHGNVSYGTKSSICYVWPVRGGQ